LAPLTGLVIYVRNRGANNKTCIQLFWRQNRGFAPVLPASGRASSRSAAILDHPAHFGPGRHDQAGQASHFDHPAAPAEGHRIEQESRAGKAMAKAAEPEAFGWAISGRCMLVVVMVAGRPPT
jgi:hypothetical protein